MAVILIETTTKRFFNDIRVGYMNVLVPFGNLKVTQKRQIEFLSKVLERSKTDGALDASVLSVFRE